MACPECADKSGFLISKQDVIYTDRPTDQRPRHAHDHDDHDNNEASYQKLWPVVPPGATATARVRSSPPLSLPAKENKERRVRKKLTCWDIQTSRTLSPGSTVVFPTPRLRSSISDASVPPSMTSRCASTSFPTSMNSCPPRWVPKPHPPFAADKSSTGSRSCPHLRQQVPCEACRKGRFPPQDPVCPFPSLPTGWAF